MDLNFRNKSAWEHLYSSTDDAIWGRQPVGFLAAALPRPEDLPPTGAVLDAASGEGRNLPVLARLGRPLVACDASPSALAKIPADLRPHLRTHTCDLAHVPEPDDSFAFILASDVIETLPEPEPVLREFARLLAPGGLLLANIPGPDDGVAGIDMQPGESGGWMYQEKYYFRFYAPAEFDALLERSGLTTVTARELDWEEEAHPNFRTEHHHHRSRIVLARRSLT